MTVEQAIEAIEWILHSDYNYDGILVYQLTLEDDIEWLKNKKIS